MPAPLPINADRDAAELRRLARRERDSRVSARLLALANAVADPGSPGTLHRPWPGPASTHCRYRDSGTAVRQ